MHVRRWQTFAAVALASGVLAGCGGSDDGNGETTEAAQRTGAVTVVGRTVERDPQLAKLLPEAQRAQLRIATAAPYPPYEYFEKDGQQLTGLDYDLGNAIGATLGVGTKWTNVSFEGVVPGVNAKKYDLIMSDMGDNETRQRAIDFVDYAKAGIGLVVKHGNPDGITTLGDLCGKPVSVESGSIQVAFIKRFNVTDCAANKRPPVRLLSFAKSSDALLAVRSGRAPAFFVDIATGIYHARNDGGGKIFEVVEDPKAPKGGYNPIKIGIGLSKATPELRDAVKAALESLVASGVYAAIFDHYGLASTKLDKITINDATP